jgi:hypothetical protein
LILTIIATAIYVVAETHRGLLISLVPFVASASALIAGIRARTLSARDLPRRSSLVSGMWLVAGAFGLVALASAAMLLYSASKLWGEAVSSTPDAKAWLREKDGGVRIIAAEMAEYAGRVNVLWTLALEGLESDPDGALTKLVEITILLENHLPLEIQDILSVATEGSERLAAEAPTD